MLAYSKDVPGSPFKTESDQGTFNPLTVQLWGSMLASGAEEMGATLERTAYSPNIKERLDHSCALFDTSGRLLAQAAHIPVHLGAMPLMMRRLRNEVTWQPGIMWVCNSPEFGGTHLPDITLTSPVYSEETANAPAQLIGFVSSRAHHADVGGISPGSLPLSVELYQEGLILPPLAIVRNGEIDQQILNLICANSRTPEERRGDLQAQIAANQTGANRLRHIVAEAGITNYEQCASQTLNYSAKLVREALKRLPPGQYTAIDRLDNVPLNGSVPEVTIKVNITITLEGDIHFDFTGSSPQVKAPVNATLAITWSACCYAVRCLVPETEELPTNEGCFQPLTILAPEGTVVNAAFGSAVAAGNVETSQRITDTIFAALAQAAPGLIPAASQGTMNNLTIGGYDSLRGKRFAYYETIGGGAGASPDSDGASAIQCHMTNTRNTPIESLESHYPLRVISYRIRTGSQANSSIHVGGQGLIRHIELLDDCTVSLLADRRELAPPGANGGSDGDCGVDTWIDGSTGISEQMPGRFTRNGNAGDQIIIETPGGGSWGASTAPEP